MKKVRELSFKKMKKPLDYLLTIVYIEGWKRILPLRDSDFRLFFIGYFSKRNRKPAKFQICSFALENEMPAQEDCVFVSCWTFLCSSQEQVLGRTFDFAHEGASGFFVWMHPES